MSSGPSAKAPIGGAVAHGYLTLAMVAPLAMQVGVIPKDAAAGLNYGDRQGRAFSRRCPPARACACASFSPASSPRTADRRS